MAIIICKYNDTNNDKYNDTKRYQTYLQLATPTPGSHVAQSISVAVAVLLCANMNVPGPGTISPLKMVNSDRITRPSPGTHPPGKRMTRALW